MLRIYGVEPWGVGKYTRRELMNIDRDYRELMQRGQEP